MQRTYSDNFPIVTAHLQKYAAHTAKGGARDIISKLLNAIKQTAVRDFMYGDLGAVRPDKLTTRSGRLAHAILGSAGESSGAHVERIYETGSGVSGEVGVKKTAALPYAEIHETGGTIRPTLADWLTFKIGEQWVKVKQVIIPARPFMHPAKDKVMKSPQAITLAGETLDHYINIYGLK